MTLWTCRNMGNKEERIIGSRCTCGHLQEDHEDTNQVGRGECRLCDCKQFKWKSFIYGH
jgi:hypothetical protein